MAQKSEQLKIGRRRITVSDLEKTLCPGEKFTKAKVIDYYIRMAKFLLPHLKDRPVTLKRFSEGVFGEAFPTFVTSSSTICPRSSGTRTTRRSNYTRFSITRRTLNRFVSGRDESDNRDKWYLIKTGRSTRNISKQHDDESSLTKRTMAEIAAAADAVWQSNRKSGSSR